MDEMKSPQAPGKGAAKSAGAGAQAAPPPFNKELGAPTLSNGSAAISPERMDAVYDVPVKVSAVLGRSKIQVKELLSLEKGSVVELDRKVGEAIDIYVNDRLVARGEVVMLEDRLGVTMTELFKLD